jgi:hypothetical protein
MVTPINEGGETPFRDLGMSNNTRGRGGINVDQAALSSLTEGIRGLNTALKEAVKSSRELVSNLGSIGGRGGGAGGGRFSNLFGGGGGSGGSVSASMASSLSSIPRGSGSTGGSSALSTGGSTGGTGGGGGGGGGLLTKSLEFQKALAQPASDLNNYLNNRIGQGADYSLQADRMSVQLQQMYGMSNSQVRNQLRMPLTSHYLLGGGTAINDLLQMQANTGLTASKQASTVEAFRTVSGFSLGTQDVTRMLSTMATPDTANRMFMMGGTGMYGIGGKEQTGMKSIQDIVKRTGLTNPEALKGALQQGSNTRQRLNAMGVPADMQDMVIQYAMQNSQYQKATGNKNAMYDPSMESDRKTMGIEGSYAVQHEKTTGERIKREERFYGRQVDNFADFEKNLRTSTKMLAMFEDALSGAIGLKISAKGHPLTNALNYAGNYASNLSQSAAQVVDAGIDVASGDPIDSMKMGDGFAGISGSPKSWGDPIRASDEAHLAKLDPRLSSLLRPMLEENPAISINSGYRSTASQGAEFKRRYRPTDKTAKTHETDREWDGVIWEMKPEFIKSGAKAMAPPGQSEHEVGLAADLQGDDTWVKNNAHRFGLITGYTGRGGPGDEPHHVEPQSTSRMTGGAMNTKGKGGGGSGSGGAGGSTKTSSVKGRVKATRTKNSSIRSTSGGVSSPNAGAIASQLSIEGNAQYKSLSRGSSSSSSNAGDPIDGGSYSIGGGGGGMSITVSPNIYLTGGADMSGDIRRIAKEVGDILENEVRLRMMRRS